MSMNDGYGHNLTDYENGVNDGRRDSRAGLTYVPGSSEYERGYRDAYSESCTRALGASSVPPGPHNPMINSGRPLAWALLFALTLAVQCQAAVELSIGTVLVSRNRDERENTSPGFMNHLAIIVSDREVVESQASIVEHGQGRGVIRTQLDDFFSRDYSRILALEPIDPAVGIRAAAVAERLVGLPFRQLSSLPGVDRPFIFERRGMNCDSVIRYSYRKASGERLRKLRIPDRALDHPELFKPAIVLRDEPSINTVSAKRPLLAKIAVLKRPTAARPAIMRPLARVRVGVKAR